MKKKTYRKKVGSIARKESGKSEAIMGDVMQIVNGVFDQCVTDPIFHMQGINKALARQKKLFVKAKAKKARRK